MSETTEFRRQVEITPAFDKRHPDPNRNYGIGSCQLRMVLIGPAGAVQFVAATGWYLPHVQDELASKPGRYPSHPLQGWDLGYHSPTAQYEGQEPFSDEPCEYIGVPCYYDGSGLQAEPVAEALLSEGSDAVWSLLEARYHDLFGATPAPQGATQEGE